ALGAAHGGFVRWRRRLDLPTALGAGGLNPGQPVVRLAEVLMKAVMLVPTFALLSLCSFGGANAILPEIHRHIVEHHHWLTDTEFAHLFAVSQAAPGPNVLFVTLLGWRVAGVVGALLATLAMFIPAAVLTFAIAGAWDRFKGAAWRDHLQAALAPLTIGLVC